MIHCTHMMFLSLVISLAAAISGTLASLSLEVQRTVDLTTQLTLMKETVTIKNEGDEKVETVRVAFDTAGGVLAYARVVNEKTSLIMTAVEDKAAPSGAAVYEVRLVKPLEPKGTTKLMTRATLMHSQQPYPKMIGQNEDQYMLFIGNNFYLSPYPVTMQSAVYRVAGAVEAVTIGQGEKTQSGKEVTVSISTKAAPYSSGSVRLHFKSNVPHITIYEMEREITVSHWSRIKIDEIIKVKHDGAKLKGQFARVDYMKNPNPPAAIKGWMTRLPLDAEDVDYRDDVGNVTTSNLLKRGRETELMLRPRFPLFGGWISDYMLNYTLPSSLYLSRAGEHYTFRFPFVSHVMPDMAIDHLTVKVSLPEGARNIQFKYKFPLDSQSWTTKATYLDTTGRPTVVVSKSDVVSDHAVDFEVHYDFAPINLLREPLMLIGFIFAFFLLAIVSVRLNFSIYTNEEENQKHGTFKKENPKTDIQKKVK